MIAVAMCILWLRSHKVDVIVVVIIITGRVLRQRRLTWIVLGNKVVDCTQCCWNVGLHVDTVFGGQVEDSEMLLQDAKNALDYVAR